MLIQPQVEDNMIKKIISTLSFLVLSLMILFSGYSDTVYAATSNDLSPFINLFSVQGATQDEHGNYEITPGTTYTMMFRFQETSSALQFADNMPMTYSFPNKINFGNEPISGTFAIKLDNEHSVQGNTYKIEEGVLTVNFNQGDDNFNTLTGSAFAGFTIYARGEFVNEPLPYTIEFNENYHKTFTEDTEHGVTVKKHVLKL